MKLSGNIAEVAWAVAFMVVGAFFMKGCWKSMTNNEVQIKRLELQIVQEQNKHKDKDTIINGD